jgi:exodeoxyribonuclease VII small subunit
MSNHEGTELAGLTFEQAFERLEAAIQALDDGDLPLDEALARFEEGTRLMRHCAKLLENAELQVQQLLTDSLGTVTLAPFESEQ